MTRPRSTYDVLTITAQGVRVGELVGREAEWYPIKDLRQLHPDGKAALLGGLPGVWVLPPTLAVMRPRATFAPRP
ncbi:hypothetical protein ACFWMQ_08625 [Streptomyces sp. NPDC058372]|uniref:hypothetical protein n=1 Tax=Streptomyces sp. NPDC058372 TaxID=3346464 RepID=UPI003659E321